MLRTLQRIIANFKNDDIYNFFHILEYFFIKSQFYFTFSKKFYLAFLMR